MGFYYGMYLAVFLLILLISIRFISFAKSHIDDGKKNHIDLMLLSYFLLLLLFLLLFNFSFFSFPSNDKLSFRYSTFFSSVFLFDFYFFFSSLFWFFFFAILFYFSFSLLLHVTTTVACYTRWRTLIALFSQLSFVT